MTESQMSKVAETKDTNKDADEFLTQQLSLVESPTLQFLNNNTTFLSRDTSPTSLQEFLWPLNSSLPLSPIPQGVIPTSPGTGFWTVSPQDRSFASEGSWSHGDSETSLMDYVFVYYCFCNFNRRQSVVGEDEMPTVLDHNQNAIGSSTVAIDNKIEQAMDLVKSHLMYAVREEVEVLKEQIQELVEKNNQLEQENSILRASASTETLSKLQVPRQSQPPSSSS